MTEKTAEQVAHEMFPANTPTQNAMRIVARNAVQADRAQRETPGDLTLKDISEAVADLLSGLSEDHVRTVIRAALGDHDMAVRFFGPSDIRAVIEQNPDLFGGITEDEIKDTIDAVQETRDWVWLRSHKEADTEHLLAAVREGAVKVMRQTVLDIVYPNQKEN